MREVTVSREGLAGIIHSKTHSTHTQHTAHSTRTHTHTHTHTHTPAQFYIYLLTTGKNIKIPVWGGAVSIVNVGWKNPFTFLKCASVRKLITVTAWWAIGLCCSECHLLTRQINALAYISLHTVTELHGQLWSSERRGSAIPADTVTLAYTPGGNERPSVLHPHTHFVLRE